MYSKVKKPFYYTSLYTEPHDHSLYFIIIQETSVRVVQIQERYVSKDDRKLTDEQYNEKFPSIILDRLHDPHNLKNLAVRVVTDNFIQKAIVTPRGMVGSIDLKARIFLFELRGTFAGKTFTTTTTTGETRDSGEQDSGEQDSEEPTGEASSSRKRKHGK
jgi:hypothetical protein